MTARSTGISLVIHPLSPMVPTVHMNLRHIRLLGPEGTAWFGGGADLTLYYLFEEDARHFHDTWQRVCERHDPEYYPRFKKWCDEYFRIEHRDEARGIGGIFFDYLKDDPEKAFAFVEDAGRNFVQAYKPIVERRVQEKWCREVLSLPPPVRWSYDYQPEAGSREEALLEALREPREWV